MFKRILYILLFSIVSLWNAVLIWAFGIDSIFELFTAPKYYWGAESMGWLWHSPLTYAITFEILTILMSFGTGVGIYKLIKHKYKSAFLWMLSPTLVLGLFILILQF